MSTEVSPWDQFRALARLPDAQIDLSYGAFLIAASEYPELDVTQQMRLLDSMAAGVMPQLAGEHDPLYAVNTLSQYLFDHIGFQGNSQGYNDPRNSYLSDVMSRRLGIPITLSIVYMEVGKRAGVPLVGIGMPGHFMVAHPSIKDIYIDTYHGGILLSERECAERLKQVTGSDDWDPTYLTPVSNREILARMLRNLKAIYLQTGDHPRSLRSAEWLLTVQPGAVAELRDRGLLYYRLGQHDRAYDDLQRYLHFAPESSDTKTLKAILEQLRQLLGR